MTSVTIQRKIKARELPATWELQNKFEPDESVRVLVAPDDPKLAAAKTLKELMDIIGKRAEKRATKLGITESDIDDNLYEK